jgi:hypothetical protein
VACFLFLFAVSAGAQAQQPPLLARDVFKNVPALGNTTVDEFMDTMGMFSAALSMGCTNCHGDRVIEGWERFADETPLKQTARRMTLMVNALNKNNFAGQRKVTCYTCHRGDATPKVTPSLAIQYGLPFEDPNDIVLPERVNPENPTPDAVFDKYINAIGGAARAGALKTYNAKGMYSGYETEHVPYPVEIFAQAPDRRTTIVDAFFGRSTRTFDGREGWIASGDKPVPLFQLHGGNLDGARIDATLTFPGGIRQLSQTWRVGQTVIDRKQVRVIQGTRNGHPVTLYFDPESGLLLRVVRFVDTVVGSVPTQIDFADYKEVGGVQIPHQWKWTWTDGQTTMDLTEVRINTPIDSARFSRPAPAVLFAPK